MTATVYKTAYTVGLLNKRSFRHMMNRWCFELGLKLDLRPNGGIFITEYLLTVEGKDEDVQELKRRLRFVEEKVNEAEH